ncbi:MAG: hypothetical protein LH660_02485 [Phormidesmis sp. CAN_BIN36]|nr:hypothetical protein [Phormidesmis sp. CAN_BIN36]
MKHRFYPHPSLLPKGYRVHTSRLIGHCQNLQPPKRSDEDLYVHGSPKGEGTRILAPFSLVEKGWRGLRPTS